MKTLFVVVFLVVIAGFGFWFYFNLPNSPSFTDRSMREATGSFGTFFFTSEEALKSFNGKVSEWFSEQGFESDITDTFYEILIDSKHHADNWKQDGLLLRKYLDAESRIYVFIPEYFSPEKQAQCIGFHLHFSGTREEVNKYERDFESLKREFLRNFHVSTQPVSSDSKSTH